MVYKKKVKTIENRKRSRVQLRPEDGVLVTITANGVNCSGLGYDISDSGIAVRFSGPVPKYNMGDKVNCEININKNINFASESEIVWVKENILGIKFCKTIKNINSEFIPIKLSGQTLLSCFVSDPIKNDEIYTAAIESFSQDYIEFSIYTDSFIFIKESTVELKLNLYYSSSDVKVRLISFDVQGKVTFIKAKVINLSQEQIHSISKFIFSTSKASPLLLKKAGLYPKKLKNYLSSKSVTDYEEYIKVLELRRLCYSSVNKAKLTDSLDKFSSELDKISRIIALYHNEEIIASATMTFPNNEEVLLDTESPLEGGYPESFPNKIDCIEISRLCIDPDYRLTNGIVKIYKYICKIFLSSNRRYLVTSADQELLKSYIKIGFKKTDLVYEHKVFKNLPHRIILYDIKNVYDGKTTGFLVWLYLWAPLLVGKNISSINYISNKSRILIKIKICVFRLFAKFIEKN